MTNLSLGYGEKTSIVDYQTWLDEKLGQPNANAKAIKQRFVKAISRALKSHYSHSDLIRLEKPNLISLSSLESLYYLKNSKQFSFPRPQRVVYLLNQLQFTPQQLWQKYASELPVNMAKDYLDKQLALLQKPSLENADYLVARTDLFLALQKALTAAKQSKNTQESLVAVLGAGGVGKTYLAASISDQDFLIDLFPDGVAWLTVGDANLRDLTQWHRHWESQLVSVAEFIEEKLKIKQKTTKPFLLPEQRLAKAIAQHALLIVLDDVWQLGSVESLLQTLEKENCRHCRVLLTSRNWALAQRLDVSSDRQVVVGNFSKAEVAQYFELKHSPLRNKANQHIIDHLFAFCGGHPFTLRLINIELQAKLAALSGERLREEGQVLSLLQDIQEDGLLALHDAFSVPESRSLFCCLDLSLQVLTRTHKETAFLAQDFKYYFLSLGLFPVGIRIPLVVLAVLWELPLSSTRYLVQLFWRHSLIEHFAEIESVIYIQMNQTFALLLYELAQNSEEYQEQQGKFYEDLKQFTCQNHSLGPLSNFSKGIICSEEEFSLVNQYSRRFLKFHGVESHHVDILWQLPTESTQSLYLEHKQSKISKISEKEWEKFFFQELAISSEWETVRELFQLLHQHDYSELKTKSLLHMTRLASHQGLESSVYQYLLSLACLGLGEHQLAKQTCEACVESLRESRSCKAKTSFLMISQCHLNGIYCVNGDFSKAILNCQSAIAFIAQYGGENHLLISQCYGYKTLAHWGVGEFKEAIYTGLKAIEISELHEQDNFRSFYYAVSAQSLIAEGHYKEAIEFCETYLAKLSSTVDSKSEGVPLASDYFIIYCQLIYMVALTLEMRFKKAHRVATEAVALNRKLFSRGNLQSSSADIFHALSLTLLGKTHYSLKICEQNLILISKTKNSVHPLYSTVQAIIAMNLVLQGKYRRAHATSLEALNHAHAFVGDSHPIIFWFRLMVVVSQICVGDFNGYRKSFKELLAASAEVKRPRFLGERNLKWFYRFTVSSRLVFGMTRRWAFSISFFHNVIQRMQLALERNGIVKAL